MARGKKAEKALMQKEKLAQALVPAEEQPYPVPGNWCWLYGESLFLPMEAKKPTGETFRYIDIDSIDNKLQVVSAPKVLPVDKAPSRASRALHTGDTVFSMVRPYLKNIAYIDESLSDAIASTGFYVCQPRSNINHRFIYYLMISPYAVDGLNTFMKGDNSPSIRKDDLLRFVYPVPPRSEQRRIVDRIESLFAKLDEVKEKAQAVVDSFETRKAAILHKAFTGELTKHWRRKHNIQLHDWESLTLNDIADYRKGPFGSSITKAMFVPNGPNTYKVYEQGNAIRKTLDYGHYYISQDKYNELKSFSVRAGDIIISCAGTIGETFTLPVNCEPGVINQALMRVRIGEKVNKSYFLYYFSGVIKTNVNNEANGTAIKNIPPFKVMKAMEIRLPSLDEQIEIVHILDNLFAKEQQAQESAEAVLEQIDTMKKSILARAFRGELGTNDPAEESAVELLQSVL